VPSIDQTIQEQIAYYRARAGEYDEWFYRRGRYDRGAEANRTWFTEIETVAHALDLFAPRGQVLELAGGTGLWTERLTRWADHVTVVDASPEVLALNRQRVARPQQMTYIEADLFEWTPSRKYDVVFFGFWLSHVPPERCVQFWDLVASTLRPDGRVFLIDSLRDVTSTAIDHTLPPVADISLTRQLNDGRNFHIYKLFYTPKTLASQLISLGWDPSFRATEHYFLYGSASRSLRKSPSHPDTGSDRVNDE
jgi:demethylmenaquinone methyltransferase/2-methoxy-6-polyprenyl-1,4-benzoquinol methylase